jgi:hypothetical protein
MHKGCVNDGSDRAVAIGEVRGWRLFLAGLRGDEAAQQDVLAEIGACAACLYVLVQFTLGVAVGRREPEAGAVQKAEQFLSRAIAKRDALI